LPKAKQVKIKLKTRKAAAKRFKLTAGGKVIRGHAYARHILTSKASKRKRKLDQNTLVSAADVPRVHAMLPYGKS
jgi:large subunit ribosomal protein L35